MISLAKLYPFIPRRFDLGNGNAMSYLDEGQGPVIVMLHGNPTWSFFYRHLVLLLRDRYRLIVPDHLGCGLSDKPRDYPYRLVDHIDNLEKLLDHLGLEHHALMVHDWGGAIGYGYAERHPERLTAQIILNTAAFRSRRMPLRIRLCRTPYLGPLMVRGLNAFAGAAVWMAVKKHMPAEVRQGYLAPYDSWENRVAVMRFIEDIPLNWRHPSWETLLRAEGALSLFKDLPTLILWGGRDFCFNDHFFHEWQCRFPKARSVYLENAGHYVLEDATAEAKQFLEGFLADYLHVN
jgi:pimeloyl-ACP methyl ester carboxylesterase